MNFLHIETRLLFADWLMVATPFSQTKAYASEVCASGLDVYCRG